MTENEDDRYRRLQKEYKKDLLNQDEIVWNKEGLKRRARYKCLDTPNPSKAAWRSRRILKPNKIHRI